MPPVITSSALPGSGAGLRLMPSSRMKGGAAGLPFAVIFSVWEVAVAVKSSAACCQPVKPLLAFVSVLVFVVWLPKFTARKSVVLPVETSCCAPAHQKRSQ